MVYVQQLQVLELILQVPVLIKAKNLLIFR
jgi:hypothetical protein